MHRACLIAIAFAFCVAESTLLPLDFAPSRQLPDLAVDWTQWDVQVWLKQERIGNMAAQCAELGVDGPVLLRIRDTHLYNVFNLGTRSRQEVEEKIMNLWQASLRAGRLTSNYNTVVNFWQFRALNRALVDNFSMLLIQTPRITMAMTEAWPAARGIFTDDGDGVELVDALDAPLEFSYRVVFPMIWLAQHADEIFGGLPWYFRWILNLRAIDEIYYIWILCTGLWPHAYIPLILGGKMGSNRVISRNGVSIWYYFFGHILYLGWIQQRLPMWVQDKIWDMLAAWQFALALWPLVDFIICQGSFGQGAVDYSIEEKEKKIAAAAAAAAAAAEKLADQDHGDVQTGAKSKGGTGKRRASGGGGGGGAGAAGTTAVMSTGGKTATSTAKERAAAAKVNEWAAAVTAAESPGHANRKLQQATAVVGEGRATAEAIAHEWSPPSGATTVTED